MWDYGGGRVRHVLKIRLYRALRARKGRAACSVEKGTPGDTLESGQTCICALRGGAEGPVPIIGLYRALRARKGRALH